MGDLVHLFHLRNARCLRKVGQGERGEGSVLGRLDDAGAAGGEGGTDFPGDHGVGKVPGRDHGRHPDRLLYDHDLLRVVRRNHDLQTVLSAIRTCVFSLKTYLLM